MAGVVWLATSITFQPKTNFGVQWTAYMIFMALVGGLGTFEGPILGAAALLPRPEISSARPAYGIWPGWAPPRSFSPFSCRAAYGAKSRAASASA